MRLIRGAASAIVLALALAACSSDPVATVDVEQTMLGGNAEEYFLTVAQQQDSLIGQCMAEQGFSWRAPSRSISDYEAAPDDQLALSGDPEYASEYGLGISTVYFARASVGPKALGYDDPRAIDRGRTLDDPNAEGYGELSESEQYAYDEALHGDGSGALGCSDQAAAEVQKSSRYEDFVAEFGQDLEEIEQRVVADPRMVQWRQAGESCLQKRGAPYASLDAAYEAFYTSVGDISLDVGLGGANQASYDIERQENPGGSARPDIEFTANQIDALSELQASEVQMALDLIECGQTNGSYVALFGTIRSEHLRDFAASNSSRLADFEAEQTS